MTFSSLVSGRKESAKGRQRETHTACFPSVLPTPVLGPAIAASFGKLPCPHCLQFPPSLWPRKEGSREDQGGEALLSCPEPWPGALGQSRPPCCWSGRCLWARGSRLKERELGWWKTLKASCPRGFEKQEPQRGRCLPRLLGLLFQTLSGNSPKRKEVILLGANIASTY